MITPSNIVFFAYKINLGFYFFYLSSHSEIYFQVISIFQIFIILSSEPDAIWSPLGEKLTQCIQFLWPWRLCTSLPVSKSQIFSDLSQEQLTKYYSFGKKIISITASVCPSKVFDSLPLFSHNLIVLSLELDAINNPDCENIAFLTYPVWPIIFITSFAVSLSQTLIV